MPNRKGHTLRRTEHTHATGITPEQIRVLVDSALAAGENPLRVLGVWAIQRAGLGASGPGLAELLGVRPSAARKALRALRAAQGAIPTHRQPSGPLGTAQPPHAAGVPGPNRTGSGPERTENGPELGGLGGLQSPPKRSIGIGLDPKTAKAPPTAGGTQEGAENDARSPSPEACAAAAGVLRVLVTDEAVVREGMRFLTERWREVGHKTARDPHGWSISVVSNWALDQGATPQQVKYARTAARNQRRNGAAAQAKSVRVRSDRKSRPPVRHCGDFTVSQGQNSVVCMVCGTCWSGI